MKGRGNPQGRGECDEIIQSSRSREFPPGASVGSLGTLFLSARYGSPQLSGPETSDY
jgi:hypothetical protein